MNHNQNVKPDHDNNRQCSSIEISNTNSNVLWQYSLSSPYMILLETCHEKTGTYSIHHITPISTSLQQFDDEKKKMLAKRPLHKHSFIEIMFVLSGSVTNRIENLTFTYTRGQCCIMNSNIRHCEVFEGNFQVVFFMFQNEYLQAILDGYKEEIDASADSLNKQPVYQLLNDIVMSTHYFDKIYLDCLPVTSADDILDQLTPLFNDMVFETVEKEAGFSILIKGIFIRIFHILSAPSLYSVKKTHSDVEQNEYLVGKIIHILEANHGRCTRKQLTEQLHYTGEYINRILKDHTGKTISEYKQSIFLNEGRRLLLDTDMSISEIISALGLSNRNYFYRLFEQEYGISPLKYRKMKKKN